MRRLAAFRRMLNVHRFYLSPEECRSDELALTESEAHHATRVLRVRPGERVVVLDGCGAVLDCEVLAPDRHSVALRVLKRQTVPAPACAITLIQAIPKGKIIESVIQKATELGVHRVVPILSERVVTHLDAESSEAKGEKWQHIAIEAIKQCGSAWLPRVEAPIAPGGFLARRERFDLSLVGSLESPSRHARVWFDQFRAEQGRDPASIGIWIGPEGDFTAAEYRSLRDAGVLPITLGPLVLRVETAATYVMAIVNYELQATPAK